MGYFKIPTTIIDKLDTFQMNFWWGHKGNKGINFLAWTSMNKPKELGGLSFKNLENFNKALI